MYVIGFGFGYGYGYRAFWVEAGGNAVVIEADAFKESDVIYKALSSRGHHDMLQTAELVIHARRISISISIYVCNACFIHSSKC